MKVYIFQVTGAAHTEAQRAEGRTQLWLSEWFRVVPVVCVCMHRGWALLMINEIKEWARSDHKESYRPQGGIWLFFHSIHYVY